MSLTEPDYPAAHSMDTVWYAVDSAGHVAVFMTGENGPLPDGSGPDGLLTDLSRIVLGPEQATRFDHIDTAQSLGVYLYDYDDRIDLNDLVDRYRRVVNAGPILQVDQLRPDIRREWKRLRFAEILFAEAEFLQPYEFFRCTSLNVNVVAYVSADGRTIRPIPGQEERFHESTTGWREDEPDAIAEYRFEGNDDDR